MHVCMLCDKGASNISQYTLRIFGKYSSVMYIGELDGDGDTDHAEVNHMCTAHPSSPPSGINRECESRVTSTSTQAKT